MALAGEINLVVAAVDPRPVGRTVGMGHKPECDRFTNRVAKSRRGYGADRRAVAQDQLIAPYVRVRRIDHQRNDAAPQRVAIKRGQRIAAAEAARLAKLDRESESCFVGGDVGRKLAAPCAIAFFETE